MKNDEIAENLLKKREQYFSSFESISNIDPYLKDLFEELKKFKFNDYKLQLKNEISQNLNDWWTNPEKGILKEEELFAILFEYDYFFKSDVEARAYGIGFWKDFSTHSNGFKMGYDIDFSANFYSVPGITLNFFDNLEKLDESNLPLQDDNEDLMCMGDEMYDMEGYLELVNSYVFAGLVAVQKVIRELDDEGLFESINYRKGFMFLIGEHDMGKVFPLIIKE